MLRLSFITVLIFISFYSLHSQSVKKLNVDFYLFTSTNLGSSKFTFQEDYFSSSVRASNRKISFLGEMVIDTNFSFVLGYENISHRSQSNPVVPNYNVVPILFGANGIYNGTRVSMYFGIKAYNVTTEFEEWAYYNFVGGHLSVVADIPHTDNLLRIGLALDYSFDGTDIDEFGEPILLTGNFTSVELNFSLDLLPLFESLWSKR